MGKKMKLLPSLIFKNKETSSPWQWPSCTHPKTESFRIVVGDDMFKTVNSIYFDAGGDNSNHNGNAITTPESPWFTNSSESASFSTVSEDSTGESLETVIRGLRSERLFFEPGDSNSILEKVKVSCSPFKESMVLAMESDDPYVDFRTSMEEMVAAHGVKDWEFLEDLLVWYLKVNGKSNHGFIVGAFVDLLVSLAASSPSSSSTTPSFYSLDENEEEGGKSPCLEHDSNVV